MGPAVKMARGSLTGRLFVEGEKTSWVLFTPVLAHQMVLPTVLAGGVVLVAQRAVVGAALRSYNKQINKYINKLN